jgi:hypothetical protein
MPPKRTPLQHFNPVKHQALDLPSDPQSPPDDVGAEHSELGTSDASCIAAKENHIIHHDAPSAFVDPVMPVNLTLPHQGAVIPRSPVSNRDRFYGWVSASSHLLQHGFVPFSLWNQIPTVRNMHCRVSCSFEP